eukprot:11204281-Lingulodinium_polyedra.AAC.1
MAPWRAMRPRSRPVGVLLGCALQGSGVFEPDRDAYLGRCSAGPGSWLRRRFPVGEHRRSLGTNAGWPIRGCLSRRRTIVPPVGRPFPGLRCGGRDTGRPCFVGASRWGGLCKCLTPSFARASG